MSAVHPTRHQMITEIVQRDVQALQTTRVTRQVGAPNAIVLSGKVGDWDLDATVVRTMHPSAVWYVQDICWSHTAHLPGGVKVVVEVTLEKGLLSVAADGDTVWELPLSAAALDVRCGVAEACAHLRSLVSEVTEH